MIQGLSLEIFIQGWSTIIYPLKNLSLLIKLENESLYGIFDSAVRCKSTFRSEPLWSIFDFSVSHLRESTRARTLFFLRSMENKNHDSCAQRFAMGSRIRDKIFNLVPYISQ